MYLVVPKTLINNVAQFCGLGFGNKTTWLKFEKTNLGCK